MRPQDTQQRSGRRQRRGPRRPQHAARTPSFHPVSLKEPEPPTFWQKIASFFKPKEAVPFREAAQRPAPRAERSGSGERQSNPERGGGERSGRPERSPERSQRKPEIVEVSSAKLYVGNLSFDAGESDLFDLFNGVGSVQNAEIVSNKHTQKSKGFAFVTMQSIEEARRAVVELHDKEFMGRKLLVSGAKSNDFQPDRRGSRD